MSSPNRAPVTVPALQKMKAAGEKLACLTAYDATFAQALDAAGVEVILVGDSLGMVVQGHDTTIPVTMDDMVYHCRSVARGRSRALLMADLPFMSYSTHDEALRNSARLMQEGFAQMVKVEVSEEQTPIIEALASNGVPVCAHIGLTPQFVHKIGGFKVQGRGREQADRIVKHAQALAAAGADLVLLECVPMALGKRVTEALAVPVIGIGAGPDPDGQILVLHDILGITPRTAPKFVRDFLAGSHSIQAAVEAYVGAVKSGSFPGPEQGYA